eukprot:UN10947
MTILFSRLIRQRTRSFLRLQNQYLFLIICTRQYTILYSSTTTLLNKIFSSLTNCLNNQSFFLSNNKTKQKRLQKTQNQHLILITCIRQYSIQSLFDLLFLIIPFSSLVNLSITI